MKIQINIEWWENEGQDEIPETDKNYLIQDAIEMVNDKIEDGYVAGELYVVMENGTQYNGTWELKEQK